MTEQTTNSISDIEVPDEVFEWASDKQKAAVEHKPGTPLLLIGGFGSGKTTAAILHMLLLCEAFPGYKVAVLRKTFNDLKLTTRPSFDQWIKPEFVGEPTNEKVVTLKNGSSFLFHHLDRPDSATILKGLEINAAILDQAEQMQESTFTILLGRLGRWKGAKVPNWVLKDAEGEWPWKDKANRPLAPLSVILTANPSEGDPELHWLWQRFSPESKRFSEKWAKLGYRSMTMPTTDNKFAGQQNIDMLMQQDEDYRKRFVEGVWVRSKGHLFSLDDQSLLDHDDGLISKITNSMNLGRSLDHGDSAPTACIWYAVDDDSNIYCFMEYNQPGITETGEWNISDHRRTITQMSKGMTVTTNIADPSIFLPTRGITGYNKREKRWAVVDEYLDTRLIAENTTINWTKADNSEALSRTRLRQYLKVDENHRHPITGELGAPHLYFIKKSPDWEHGISHAITEIRGAKRLQVGESDGKTVYGDDRDPKIPDHCLDCVAPGTRILTSDLRYVPAGDIKVGDELFGFDEKTGGHKNPRHWKRSVVKSIGRVTKPSYRLMFEDGASIVCSYDHQWLSVLRDGLPSKRRWIKTEDLDGQGHWDKNRSRGKLSGDRLVLKPLDVWGNIDSWSDGYLAAAFDGEGCLSYASAGEGCFSLSFTQRDNVMMSIVERELRLREFSYSKNINHTRGEPVFSLQIRGGLSEKLRFLGSVRPHRLLGKLRGDLGRFQCGRNLAVVNREFLGDVELVSIQTSTRTFIAEGFASHNCVRYIVNSRPLAASTSPDRPMVMKAIAKPKGRVTVSVPPIEETVQRVHRGRGQWKSHFGGYLLAFCVLGVLL